MPDSQPHEDSRARSIAAGLSYWRTKVDPRPLSGGLTNTSFVVDDDGSTYVVRVGGNIPEHGIVRSHELAVCNAAHACGLSPEVVHHEPGALVMRFVEAKTLTAEDVRDPRTTARIIDLIRRCHTEMPNQLRGASQMFWVFQVCRDYIAIASEESCRVQPQLKSLAAINAALEDRLGPIHPVFCHNDLLPANFLDDGERLWLLDWEYGGWNTPFFDLANLSSNAEMNANQRDSMLELYLNRSVEEADVTKLAVAACASLLRESLWSIVQETHSALDVDYIAYTDDHLARLDNAYQSLISAT
jgi:thiamine kinase-like enzyme